MVMMAIINLSEENPDAAALMDDPTKAVGDFDGEEEPRRRNSRDVADGEERKLQAQENHSTLKQERGAEQRGDGEVDDGSPRAAIDDNSTLTSISSATSRDSSRHPSVHAGIDNVLNGQLLSAQVEQTLTHTPVAIYTEAVNAAVETESAVYHRSQVSEGPAGSGSGKDTNKAREGIPFADDISELSADDRLKSIDSAAVNRQRLGETDLASPQPSARSDLTDEDFKDDSLPYNPISFVQVNFDDILLSCLI